MHSNVTGFAIQFFEIDLFEDVYEVYTAATAAAGSTRAMANIK